MRLADRTVLEAHGSSRRAMAARHADGSWLQRVIAALLLSKEMWLVYASSFLCGRASLGSGIFPFGLALFWTVARSGQRTHAVGAALGVVLGMATAAPAYRWLAVLVTLLGGLFLLETEPSPARARRPPPVSVAAGVVSRPRPSGGEAPFCQPVRRAPRQPGVACHRGFARHHVHCDLGSPRAFVGQRR